MASSLSQTVRHSEFQRCLLCGEEAVPLLVAFPRGPDREFLYRRCSACGLIAEDAENYSSATFDLDVQRTDLDETASARFQDVYGESIQVVRDSGELYQMYSYHDSGAMKAYLADRVIRQITEAQIATDGVRILEVGCADGFLLRELQRRLPTSQVFGVEPSPVSCEQAAAQNTPTVQGTMDSVDLTDQAPFDIAIAFGNLMLHPDPLATLRAMFAALRPGGIVVFDVKNANCVARKIAIQLGRTPLSTKKPFKGFVARNFTNLRYVFDRTTVQDLVTQAGFTAVALSSEPPRAVLFANDHDQSNGLSGFVWGLLDKIDARSDNRAWIEVRAAKP